MREGLEKCSDGKEKHRKNSDNKREEGSNYSIFNFQQDLIKKIKKLH